MTWRDAFIADMEAIGLLVHDACLGCGKRNCDSCPAGTGTAVVHDALSPEAARKFKQISEKRLEDAKGNA